MTALRPANTRDLAAQVAAGGAAIGISQSWGTIWSRSEPGGEFTRISLAGLTDLLSLAKGDLTCRVGAGISHRALADQLSARGLEWPLRPLPGQSLIAQSYLSGAASAGSGIFSNPRDWLLGSTLISGRGELVTSGGATLKNSSGYDLGRACMGSMGLVAVPAELQLRLRPLPEQRLAVRTQALDRDGYAKLLTAVRAQLDVTDRFEISGDGESLKAVIGFAGARDRVAEALVSVGDITAEPISNDDPGAVADCLSWAAVHRVPIDAAAVGGLARDAKFIAYPLQRLAYLSNGARNRRKNGAGDLTLPLSDSKLLRGQLELLADGLDPDRVFV